MLNYDYAVYTCICIIGYNHPALKEAIAAEGVSTLINRPTQLYFPPSNIVEIITNALLSVSSVCCKVKEISVFDIRGVGCERVYASLNYNIYDITLSKFMGHSMLSPRGCPTSEGQVESKSNQQLTFQRPRDGDFRVYN